MNHYFKRTAVACAALLALAPVACKNNPIFHVGQHGVDARGAVALPEATTAAQLPADLPTALTPGELAHLPAPATLTDGGALYQRYCALCHGTEAKGYAADNAPNLISKTFLESATPDFIRDSIGRGRPGTAMAGYATAMGGPLMPHQIDAIVHWLRRSAPVAAMLPSQPLVGDVARGQALYVLKCQECHGTPVQRAQALHLFNPVLLQLASDGFLRYAVAKGRPDTKMTPWEGILDPQQTDDVIAYLRSTAQPAPPAALPPGMAPAEPWSGPVVIHEKGKAPEFHLKDDRLVSPDEVHAALAQRRRIVILDARAPSDWLRLHIPGALSLPYYDMKNIDQVPNDGTWVIAYCACPHHASGAVVDELRKRGYKHTAVMDEGIFAYQHKGFEVVESKDALPTPAPPVPSMAGPNPQAGPAMPTPQMPLIPRNAR